MLYMHYSWSADDWYLLTASRDATCKLWRFDASSSSDRRCECILQWTPFSGVAVTAVDVSSLMNDEVLLACGSEAGEISVWRVSASSTSPQAHCIVSTSANQCHGLMVKRLNWSPVDYRKCDKLERLLRLGSCGDDHTVRVFDFEYQ